MVLDIPCSFQAASDDRLNSNFLSTRSSEQSWIFALLRPIVDSLSTVSFGVELPMAWAMTGLIPIFRFFRLLGLQNNAGFLRY